MNALQQYLLEVNMSDVDAMYILNDMGVISDNCVTPKQVCESDAVKAVEYLKSL